MDSFGSDSIYVMNIYTWGKSSVVIFYRINKTRLVSFFVNRRQSRDRFRINDNSCKILCLLIMRSYGKPQVLRNHSYSSWIIVYLCLLVIWQISWKKQSINPLSSVSDYVLSLIFKCCIGGSENKSVQLQRVAWCNS